MKIYKTNAALGYGQYAYLIKMDINKYLCIGTKNNFQHQDIYKTGKIIDNLEECYIEESDYKISDSPLFGTFFFDYFVENFNKEFISQEEIKDIMKNKSSRKQECESLSSSEIEIWESGFMACYNIMKLLNK